MQERRLPGCWEKAIPTFPADPKGLATRHAQARSKRDRATRALPCGWRRRRGTVHQAQDDLRRCGRLRAGQSRLSQPSFWHPRACDGRCRQRLRACEEINESTGVGERRERIEEEGGQAPADHRRLWRQQRRPRAALEGRTAEVRDQTGLTSTVAHLPPGTSNWNRIEHRMFAFISQNWRGKPLLSYKVIVQLIAAIKTPIARSYWSMSATSLTTFWYCRSGQVTAISAMTAGSNTRPG